VLEHLYMPEPNSGCWLWLGSISKKGYGKGPNGRHAHRTIFEHYKGPIPNKLELDHKCRVRSCVNPDHLEPVTTKVNVHRGLNLKISEEIAVEMRQLKGLFTLAEIAANYGISTAQVSRILKGERSGSCRYLKSYMREWGCGKSTPMKGDTK